MLSVIKLMAKTAGFPFYALWKLYLGLWWAFEPDARPAAAPTPSPDGLGIEPQPLPQPARRPTGALRGGFAGTALASLGLGAAFGGLDGAGQISSPTAFVAWIWSTLLVAVLSLLAVRTVSRGQRPPLRERVAHAAAAGASKACAGVARAATIAACGVKAAAHKAAPAVEAAAKQAAPAVKAAADQTVRFVAASAERARPRASAAGARLRTWWARNTGQQPMSAGTAEARG